jgi:hypothetical protein
MIGGRTRYRYPRGKPIPLRLIDGVSAIAVVLWLVLARRGLRWGLAVFAAVLAIAIIDSKLHVVYEHNGHAIRIAEPQYRASFPHGIPIALRVLRYAFFAAAACLLGFGVAPIRFEVARIGMITSVLALFAVGLAHFLLELRYARKQ